jgi:hypothetical protein
MPAEDCGSHFYLGWAVLPRVEASSCGTLAALQHKRACLPCGADFGVEEAVSIENLGKAEISKQLEQLVQKGESMPRRVRTCTCTKALTGSCGGQPGDGATVIVHEA